VTHPVVVVGAGVAGLTIAHQLAARGYAVTVVERESVVGGLARTFHYGDFHFDLGPHRFHTDNPRVEAYIRSVLGGETIEIKRTSGARMFGKIHEWPLRPSVLLSMPFGVMVRASLDLLRRKHHPGVSFEADILNKYGPTLYEIFFKPYTQKFLFYAPDALHRDWARAGVNRAVIDKRASADSLWSLLRTTFLPKPVETTFLYAAHGVGRFPELVSQAIVAQGGKVLTGRSVTGVETSGNGIAAVMVDGERLPCSRMVWTAPITLLNRLLGIDGIDLEFLSTIFYNIEVNKPLDTPYQWTYFGGDEVYSRISAPPAFAETMVPKGKSALCVELTCREGDDRWGRAAEFVDPIVRDAVRTGVIASAADVQNVHVERVPNTYPIYKINYLDELTRNLRQLAAYRNLLLAGRSGRFWYNNMDHSIGQGLTMSDRILAGETLAEIDDGAREYWA
jgi:protoporphyrinogen oxidase